jgi:hypothetical protein
MMFEILFLFLHRRSQDAGVLEKREIQASCFSPAPGGSDAKAAFQHAAFKGHESKSQEQRGRRGSAAGIRQPVKNHEL